MEPSMQFLTDDFKKYGWGATKILDAYVLPYRDDLEKALKAGEESGKAFYQLAVTRIVKGYTNLPTAYVVDFDTAGLVTGYTATPFHRWPGLVHSEPYSDELLDIDFPAGTLLFTQPKVIFGPGILKYNKVGADYVPLGPTWSITAKLLYQEQGWNAFYRPKCEGTGDDLKEVEDPYYAMVHKGCKASTDQKYARHLPYKYADLSEFIFNIATFPPSTWPPVVGP
jgi:hypothetical protein